MNDRHYKSWRLTGLYVLAPIVFSAGYVVRELGAFDYTNVPKYIATICLVYIPPYVTYFIHLSILPVIVGRGDGDGLH